MNLTQNCLPPSSVLGLPWVCVLGNIAGYCSSIVWLLVLIPQVYLNWKRKSVQGLSVVWALANFTASLVNCFFAFRLHLPPFSLFSATYMPVLEAFLLVQFLLYSSRPFSCEMVTTFCVGGATWVATLLVALLFPQWTSRLEWLAVVLWSVELFPQLYLNLSNRSTEGQALGSLVLTLFGKTTDFGSAYLLAMPPQTHVLAFFSSSQAYLNITQLIYYRYVSTETPNIVHVQGTLDELPGKGRREKPNLLAFIGILFLVAGIVGMGTALLVKSGFILSSGINAEYGRSFQIFIF
eukprot:TRINITY_DN13124_c0_g1_i4.p2 TRINITY_DN13124_c0_g1~~TRINITY_DN13124_c0_g1_i4.p2  ORF type:complete len:294 (+),score=31.12 TRINITY_DN13124_c0_g1_i4:94-975(+)